MVAMITAGQSPFPRSGVSSRNHRHQLPGALDAGALR
jgi:hypothetical protein